MQGQEHSWYVSTCPFSLARRGAASAAGGLRLPLGPSRGRCGRLQNEAGAAHAALLKQLNDTEEAARAAAERAAKQLADAKQADAEARAAAQQRHADAVAKGEARHAAAVEEGKVNVANTIARMERQKKGELEEQASLHEQNVARINSAHKKV